MKKHVLTFIMLLAAAVGCSGSDSGEPTEQPGDTQQAVGACVVAEVTGSVGVAPATATGFITSIVPSGTDLQITYTPASGPPVVGTVSLGAEGGAISGSWTGAKATTIEPVGNVLKVNGVAAMTFASDITDAFGPGTLASWVGATGGITQIAQATGFTGKHRGIQFSGRDSGATKNVVKYVSTTCTATLDYGYTATNDYLITVTANDATSVEFFNGATSLGTDNSPPFTKTITAGLGSLSAFATFPGGGILDMNQLRLPLKPSLSAGLLTSCLTFTGKLYCVGEGDYGALGNGGTADATSPVQIGTSKNISKVAMHNYGGCWMDENSNQMVSCWGRNVYGITGLDPTVSTQSTSPVVITGSGSNVADIAVGEYHACLLRTNGDMYCWGRGSAGQLGNGGTSWSHTLVGPILTNVAKIAAGGDTTCAVLNNLSNDLYCWGRDDYGQVGNGGSGVNAVTSPAYLLPNVVNVAVGYRHTCAADSGGNMQCWGRNDAGQLMLGYADAVDHVSPALSTPTGTFTGIFSGYNLDTCFIQSGALKCIGENTLGEMGNNTTSAYELTTKTATGFTSLVGSYSIGGGHALGFRAGHVYAWGDNSHGQLGDPAVPVTPPLLTPHQIPGF